MVSTKIVMIMFYSLCCNFATATAQQIDTVGAMQKLETALLIPDRITSFVFDSTVTVIPPEIQKLYRLREVQFVRTPISSLPEEFYALPLESVAFVGTPQLDISRLLLKLKRVKTLSLLYLNDLSLTELPDQIGELTQLQSLAVWDNQLKTLPASIGSLVDLEDLSLAHNQVDSLPATISNLKKLRFVSLLSNNLRRLPANFSSFPNLTEVELAENPALDIDTVVAQLSQYSLQALDISNCRIAELPTTIKLLRHLTRLHLNDNQLVRLPQEVLALKELEHLAINNNQLECLPANVGNLSHLKYIEVASNHIRELPRSLDTLRDTLVTLILTGNPLPEEERTRIRETFTHTYIEFE